MNELVKTGKRRAILISISILYVSLHTIYTYHAILPEVETKKLIQQIIRFVLTFALLLAVYKGKKWAKIILTVLLSLATLGALFALIRIEGVSFVSRIPLMVMVFVYAIAVYHFSMSKSFKAFFDFQNGAYFEDEENDVIDNY